MYKWFACFMSGIKETGGDFRSNQPAVDLLTPPARVISAEVSTE